MTWSNSAVIVGCAAAIGATAALGCSSKSDGDGDKKQPPAPTADQSEPGQAGAAPTTAATGVARDVTSGDLPTATELLDRQVEVTGGRAAREKVTSVKTESRMIMPSLGGKGRAVTYAASPRMFYMRAELPIGVQESGTDGDTVWVKEPSGGVRLLGGVEKAEALLHRTLQWDLHWRELYRKVETVSVEEIDGKPAFHVKLTTPNKTVWHHYFDQAAGLLVRVDGKIRTGHGPIRTELYFSDYREVEGIKMPFKMITVVKGVEHTSVAERVDLNVEIPQGTFDLPAAVQQLVDKREATRRLKSMR